ncbi:hypothetical protein [Bradyrhizobium sp. RDI18]
MKHMLHEISFGATFEMRLDRYWKVAAARHRCSKTSLLKVIAA